MFYSDQDEQIFDADESPEIGDPQSAETPGSMSVEAETEMPLDDDTDQPETDVSAEPDSPELDEAGLEEIVAVEQSTDSEPSPAAAEPAVEETELTDEEQVPEADIELEAPTEQAAPEEQSEPTITADIGLEDLDEVQAGDEDGRSWYVVHCYSGYENKVRHNLEQRIETMGMKDRIFDIVVPTEEEIEVKEGKRRTVERRVFPGYILVNMVMTEESWYVVRNTPGVTGFVGMGNTPTPLRPEEVSQIIKRMEAEAPRIKVTFKKDERVRIVDGPFNDFRGTVAEIDMERAKVRVMVNFFGRETPVELDFLQVEKT